MQRFYDLSDLLAEHPMFAIGMLLVVGHLAGKAALKVHLPEISGYIIAGLLVSPSLTGLFSEAHQESFHFITEVALGLVALTIGAEFTLGKLRHIGRGVIIITFVQVIVVFSLVSSAMWLMGLALPFALLLGMIATATEPSTTVAEVQSLRARGRFVDYLFSVIALDDAVCVVFFSLMFAVISRLLYGYALDGALAFQQVLWAMKEIVVSLMLGIVAGMLLHRLTRLRKSTNEILILSMGIIFITTAAALVYNLSPLLTNLAMGALLINASRRNYRIMRTLEPLTPPVYALFFILAGTKIDYRILAQPGILLLGAVYIAVRAGSKYGGVYLGCRFSGVTGPIRRYMGWCMVAQGGVSLGLILLVQSSPLVVRMNDPGVDMILTQMLNIILMSVFVSELIGPPLTKMGILRGCETVEVRHDR